MGIEAVSKKEKRSTCSAGSVAKIGVKMLSSFEPQVDHVTDPVGNQRGAK